MDTSAVELDGYIFKLVGKYKLTLSSRPPDMVMDYEKYKIYKIRVLFDDDDDDDDDLFEFYCYRSRSEGGILRYALHTGRMFMKGKDYIQTSVIDLRLQTYISNVEHRIPEFDHISREDLMRAQGYNDVFGGERVHVNKWLYPLSVCRTECVRANRSDGFPELPIMKHRLEVIRDVRAGTKDPDALRDAGIYTDVSKYDIVALEHLISDMRYRTGDPVVSSNGEPAEEPLHNDPQDWNNNKLASYAAYYMSISEYLRKHFRIVRVEEDPSFVPFYHMEVKDTVMQWLKRYTVVVEDRESRDQLEFEYVQMLMSTRPHFGSAEVTQTFNVLVHIKPVDTEITAFGVSEEYCPAGYYVAKLLDYKIQVPFTTMGARSVTRDYTVIADIIEDRWPNPYAGSLEEWNQKIDKLVATYTRYPIQLRPIREVAYKFKKKRNARKIGM